MRAARRHDYSVFKHNLSHFTGFEKLYEFCHINLLILAVILTQPVQFFKQSTDIDCIAKQNDKAYNRFNTS
jgi:hypothetical protein